MIAGENASRFRLELERVLNSDAFRSSGSVRRLLAYLGEKSLEGHGEGLKEFTIGAEAFNKPPDYDPQQDPTVRVLASKLRHKLDDYYRTEGADDPGRIEFPKGHYLLTFQVRQAEADTGRGRDWRRISWVLAGMLAAVLLSAAYWRAALQPKETQASQAWPADLKLLWRSYLESNRPILIVLGTPLFTKFTGGFFRDPRLNLWEEAEQSGRVRAVQRALGSAYASPSYTFTGIGEAHGTFLLSKLFLTASARLGMKRSAALSWEDVGTHNVIFLGSPKFNPQLKDLPVELDFAIEGGSLRNLRPLPGEPEVFPETWTPRHAALLEDHALVTRLPGLHGRGEITILAASSTEGTWAATEYMTGHRHAADLVPRLRRPSGQLPDCYQVVLRAKFKDQVPIEISYVTHHVLKATGATPAGGD